jgi:hypothetical protein
VRRVFALAAVALTGCTLKAEFSMMKQWDRPAERTITEDTSHNVKQPPKTVIETQDPIRVEPAPQEPSAPAPAQIKPMNFEAPAIIVPEAQKIQTIYIHEHKSDDRACYVRKVVGVFAMKGE